MVDCPQPLFFNAKKKTRQSRRAKRVRSMGDWGVERAKKNGEAVDKRSPPRVIASSLTAPPLDLLIKSNQSNLSGKVPVVGPREARNRNLESDQRIAF